MASALTNLAYADSEHRITSSVLLRFGIVEGAKEAEEIAVRGGVGWLANWTGNANSFAEIAYVGAVRNDYFDGELDNGKAKIPDAAGFAVKQAFLSHHSTHVTATAGRQKITMMDGRLIGSNAFWLNEQTFDAISLEAAISSNLEIKSNYLFHANRINGPKANFWLDEDDIRYVPLSGVRPANDWGAHNLGSLALEAVWRTGVSTVNFYHLNHNNHSLETQSSQISGLSWQRHSRLFGWKITTDLSALAQYYSGETVPYYRVKAHAMKQRFKFSGSYELLDSRNGVSFTTPLASLHDFQGSSDQFLNTPTEGLQDLSINASFHSRKCGTTLAQFHLYEDKDDDRLGREVDLEWKIRLATDNEINVNASRFWSSSGGTIDKAFLTLTHRFE